MPDVGLLSPNSKPLVSIVIPCFNAEDWVAEAIESCLNQNYTSTEIILIDDGSTDNSYQIAKRFSKRIYCETGPNKGGNAARNRGLKLSQGEYVQFLDADDILGVDKLSVQVPRLLEKEHNCFIGGCWGYYKEQAPNMYSRETAQSNMINNDLICGILSDESWRPSFAYLYKKKTLIEIGGWDESLACMQDVNLTLRLLMSGAKYTHTEAFCGYYRRPIKKTVSTRTPHEFQRQCLRNYLLAEEFFARDGWTHERHMTLAECFFNSARYYSKYDQDLFLECLQRCKQHHATYLPQSPKMKKMAKVFGLENTLRCGSLNWFIKKAIHKNVQ